MPPYKHNLLGQWALNHARTTASKSVTVFTRHSWNIQHCWKLSTSSAVSLPIFTPPKISKTTQHSSKEHLLHTVLCNTMNINLQGEIIYLKIIGAKCGSLSLCVCHIGPKKWIGTKYRPIDYNVSHKMVLSLAWNQWHLFSLIC